MVSRCHHSSAVTAKILARTVLWDVATRQHGFGTAQQASLASIGMPEVQMLVHRGTLHRVAHGVYRFPQYRVGEHDKRMLAILWARVPEAVLTHGPISTPTGHQRRESRRHPPHCRRGAPVQARRRRRLRRALRGPRLRAHRLVAGDPNGDIGHGCRTVPELRHAYSTSCARRSSEGTGTDTSRQSNETT